MACGLPRIVSGKVGKEALGKGGRGGGGQVSKVCISPAALLPRGALRLLGVSSRRAPRRSVRHQQPGPLACTRMMRGLQAGPY